MPTAPEPPLRGSRQVLLVTAAGWQSTVGRLQRHARPDETAAWAPVGPAIDVTLGRNGLAWGRGLHPPAATGAELKREGDGRAPAGIFAISSVFGEAAADSPLARALRLPYRAATDDLKCIDDPASRHYNRFVDRSACREADWASHEDMRRTDGRYALGAVIDHNMRPTVAGAGSCIFLHVWAAPGVPTAGCTAAAHGDVETICRWLDGDAGPRLVLLPAAEYARRREAWKLP